MQKWGKYMQIDKIQPNQTTFGTMVKMDPYTARIISVSKAKNKVLKGIHQLQINGSDDILYLSLGRRESFTIKASVFKREGNDYFVSFAEEQPISYMMKNGKNKLVNIIEMYTNAKNKMHAVDIDKKGFQKFLMYIE